MLINDYIVYGGKNLNDPPQKSVNFSRKAEELFWKLYKDISDNNSDVSRYIEHPIDSDNRIFIKSLWHSREDGSRPTYYCIGFVLPKQLYVASKEYFLINQALNNIPMRHILLCLREKQPIEFSATGDVRQSSFWTPWSELQHMHFYGENIDANLIKACSAISINNIDDWFERLVLAFNPCCVRDEYNILISKTQEGELPYQPSWVQETDVCQPPEDLPKVPQERSHTVIEIEKPVSQPAEAEKTTPNVNLTPQSNRSFKLVFTLLILSLLVNIFLGIALHYNENELNANDKKYHKLKTEKGDLENAKNELQEKCDELGEKIVDLTNELSKLKSTSNEPQKKKENLKLKFFNHQNNNLI